MLEKEIFKLGFGLMRLPRLADGETIDVEQTARMADAFLAAGGTYFDTAYAYPGSEEAIRKALVERVPRDKYTLASKLIAFGVDMDEEKAKKRIENTFKEYVSQNNFDEALLSIKEIGTDEYNKHIVMG